MKEKLDDIDAIVYIDHTEPFPGTKIYELDEGAKVHVEIVENNHFGKCLKIEITGQFISVEKKDETTPH